MLGVGPSEDCPTVVGTMELSSTVATELGAIELTSTVAVPGIGATGVGTSELASGGYPWVEPAPRR